MLTTNGRGIQTDTAMAEVKELIGGYSVIAADSLEQAAELAKGTPFLNNNPVPGSWFVPSGSGNRAKRVRRS